MVQGSSEFLETCCIAKTVSWTPMRMELAVLRVPRFVRLLPATCAANRLLPDLDGDEHHHQHQQQQQVQQMHQVSPASLSAAVGPAAGTAPRPLRRGLGSTASVEEDIFSTVGGLELGGHDLAAAVGGGSDHLHSGDHAGGSMPSAASLADLAPVDTPSRTLLVQNVAQEVSDEELRRVFAAHGDLRMLYTAAKACGLVIVGYFDLRAAVAATTALQGFVLAGRPLNVAYSAPKKGESNQINQVCVHVSSVLLWPSCARPYLLLTPGF